jgi:hypothetical protein
MSVSPYSVKNINKRNREFWAERRALLAKRMADDVLRDIAFDTLADEVVRQVPLYFRKTVEKALEDAESAQKRFLSARARKAGRAAKPDPLKQLIEQIVERHPDINARKLLEELRRHSGGPVIDEVAKKRIYYRIKAARVAPAGQNGNAGIDRARVTSASAPISGLKHRLTRARKKINTRSSR